MREVFLEKMAKAHGWKRGAEIGVWYGRTFFHLLETVPDLVLYGVDNWQNSPLIIHHCDQGQNRKDVMERALFKFPDRGIVLNMTSIEAARLIPDNQMDFVFIDADHSYENVKIDIHQWLPKVKSGGFLTGHDWDWETVRKAVDECIGEVDPGYPKNDFVWVWRKP